MLELRSAVASQGLRIERRLQTIATTVERLNHKMPKDYYTTSEFAALANLSACTVREACREGRIAGEHAESGRGGRPEWRISHVEYVRFQREGWRPRKAS